MKKKQLAYMISFALLCQTAQADENSQACDKDKNADCETEQMQNYDELPLVSVTANRMETDITKYAGQISVLNEDSLQSKDNIIKSLATIPGIETGNDFGRSIGSQFKIRGFGYGSEARVIIEQDGVKRSPSLFSKHISSFRTDSDLLKRVEVVKGASSILHGSGAIGGIISMQTKDAEDFINDDKNIGFTIGSRLESNNLKSGRFAFAAAPKDLPIDFLIYGKKAKLGDSTLADGGFVDDEGVKVDKAPNDEDIKTGYIKAGWDITPEMRLSLSAYKYKENLETTWQTLYHHDPGDSPVRGNLRQTDYVADFTYEPSDNPWVNLSAKWYKSDASYHRINAGVSRRGTPYLVDYTNQDKRWGLAIKNIAEFNTGSIEHQLITGIDYDDRREDALFLNNGKLSDFGSFPNHYQDFGFYIQDTMEIGIVDLTIGGRYDKFKRKVELPNRDGYSDSHFSPKISAAVEVTDGFNLLAGYSETFRGPTPNETGAAGSLNPHYYYLPNNSLKAETAKEVEVGFSIDKDNIFTADDSLFIKATYFDGKIKDMISLKRLPALGKTPDNDKYKYQTYAKYLNVTNARRRGVELEATYDFNGWHLGAGYEHLKLYNEDTGKRISSFADKLSLRTGYFYEPWGLDIGAQVTHTFRAKRDKYHFTRWGDTYTYVNRSFTIVDLKGQWTPENTGYTFLDDGFNLQFGVNNVFNKKFTNPARVESTSAVGKGRNFYLEFEKTF